MTNRSEQVSPRLWWHIAGLAEKRDMTVDELVAAAVAEFVKPKPKPKPLKPVVVEAKLSRAVQLENERRAHRELLVTAAIRLRSKGLTIPVIADLLGYSPTWISKILCDHGLRSHTRKDAA